MDADVCGHESPWCSSSCCDVVSGRFSILIWRINPLNGRADGLSDIIWIIRGQLQRKSVRAPAEAEAAVPDYERFPYVEWIVYTGDTT